MDPLETTRRGFLASTAALIGFTANARATISYPINYIFKLYENSLKRPEVYSYDMIEWRGTGVLQFNDGDYFEFGDSNYPPTDLPESGGRILPMHIDIKNMDPGTSILLVGVMSLLLAAVAILRNYAAGIMWALAFVLLIVSGLFGMQLQLFWLAIIFVGVLLAIGLAIRWGSQ